MLVAPGGSWKLGPRRVPMPEERYGGVSAWVDGCGLIDSSFGIWLAVKAFGRQGFQVWVFEWSG